MNRCTQTKLGTVKDNETTYNFYLHHLLRFVMKALSMAMV
jgi:hypothetical protein